MKDYEESVRLQRDLHSALLQQRSEEKHAKHVILAEKTYDGIFDFAYKVISYRRDIGGNVPRTVLSSWMQDFFKGAYETKTESSAVNVASVVTNNDEESTGSAANDPMVQDYLSAVGHWDAGCATGGSFTKLSDLRCGYATNSINALKCGDWTMTRPAVELDALLESSTRASEDIVLNPKVLPVDMVLTRVLHTLKAVTTASGMSDLKTDTLLNVRDDLCVDCHVLDICHWSTFIRQDNVN